MGALYIEIRIQESQGSYEGMVRSGSSIKWLRRDFHDACESNFCVQYDSYDEIVVGLILEFFFFEILEIFDYDDEILHFYWRG